MADGTIARVAAIEQQARLEFPARADRVLSSPAPHRVVGRIVRDAALLLAPPVLPVHIRQAQQDTRSDDHTEQARESPTSTLLMNALRGAVSALVTLLNEDGTFRSGDNLESPPDTAFTVNDLAWARAAIARLPDFDPSVRGQLDHVLESVTPALVHGGVHTPNHRWEISSALARIWEVHGHEGAADRAVQWLGEGVDLQDDGLFSERSPNYAAHVSIPSLLALGRILERPSLIEAADRATHVHAELTDQQGWIESLTSRRQDQFARFDGGAMFPLFRAHAARTSDPISTRAAERTLERIGTETALDLLAMAIEVPEVLGPLPTAAPEPTPLNPETVRLGDSNTSLIDHGLSRTVLFAGTDTQALGRATSGASSNPTFLSLLGRDLTVSGLRLSRDFFSLGPFRPTALEEDEQAPGGVQRFTLTETVQAKYFHPLPDDARRPDGDYPLGFNGRFAGAMHFSERPANTVALSTTAQVTIHPAGVSITFSFVGPTADICLLLALEGGDFSADLASDDHGRRVLPLPDVQDSARCLYGTQNEQLVVEAQGASGHRAFYEPGEAYTFLGGTDEPAGDRLLIPASTLSPLTLTLHIDRNEGPHDERR
jgi:hypothetical protein